MRFCTLFFWSKFWRKNFSLFDVFFSWVLEDINSEFGDEDSLIDIYSAAASNEQHITIQSAAFLCHLTIQQTQVNKHKFELFTPPLSSSWAGATKRRRTKKQSDPPFHVRVYVAPCPNQLDTASPPWTH